VIAYSCDSGQIVPPIPGQTVLPYFGWTWVPWSRIRIHF